MVEQYAIPSALSIPYDGIDAEHEKLVVILNSALRMIQSDQEISADSMGGYLADFLDALTSHFEHEEQEMSELNYHGLVQHKLSHSHCIERVQGLQQAIITQPKRIDKNSLDEIFDVVVDDIIRADSGFKTFLYARNLLR